MSNDAVIGLCKALYAYQPQAQSVEDEEKELAIAEGDILYILEKGDDQWWKVKKKAEGDEETGASGLVPATYVDPVPPIGHCIALYDYDRQTSEEITFREASRITIYDKEDPDWYLVSCGTEYGFAPSNYLEESGIGGQSPAVIAQQQPNSHASYHALPPPIHGSASDHSDDYDHHQKIYPHGRDSIAAISELAPPIVSNINASRSTPDHVDHTLLEETRESLPANSKRPQLPDRATSQAAPDFQAQSRPTPRPFRTWSVQEVDGKKKKRGGTFGVGNMELSYAPGSSKESMQTWPITSLVRYASEKKHVFIDLASPPKAASYDFHAGSTEVADEICAYIGEMAGAARAPGIREIAVALKDPLPEIPANSGLAQKERESAYTSRSGEMKHADSDGDEVDYSPDGLLSPGYKFAVVLYDFTAQGSDEVSVLVGQKVLVLNDTESRDWWKIRAGKVEGVVPADYLDVQPIKSSHLPSRKKVSAASSEHDQARKGKHKDISDGSTGKLKPDSDKIRSWTDRSASFKVDAQLLGCSDGKIHLHKTNGVKISVPVAKMSEEDVKYVERKIGRSLEAIGEVTETSQTPTLASDANVGSEKEQDRERKILKANAAKGTGSSDYDWFDFFLSANIDPNVCQRYSAAFDREGLVESDIADLESGMLRNLGIKEGDILRIGRAVDARLGRKKVVPQSFSDDFNLSNVLQREPMNGDENPSLLTGPGGVLRNNTRRGRPERSTPVNDAIDPRALKGLVSEQKASVAGTTGFDNDAWSVKSSVQQSRQSIVPNPTGALRELSLLDQPLVPIPIQNAPTRNHIVSPPRSSSQPTNQNVSVNPPVFVTSAFQIPLPTQYTGFQQTLPQAPMDSSPQFMQPRPQSTPAQPAFTPSTQFGAAIVAHKTGGGNMQNFVPPPLYPGQPGYQQQIAQQQNQILARNETPASYQDPFKTGAAQFTLPTGVQQNHFPTPLQPLGVMAPSQQHLAGLRAPIISQQTALPPQAGFGGIPFQASIMMPNITGFNPAQPFNAANLPPFPGQNVAPMSHPGAHATHNLSPPLVPLQTQNGYGVHHATQFPYNGMNGISMRPNVTQPQPQAMMSEGMVKMQAMTDQQYIHGFQPVQFGRPATLSATSTGKRANLAAATPNNPFGF